MLTDVAEFKQQYGVTSDGEDLAIRGRLIESQAAAEAYCNRTFELATYTEFFDGGQPSLFLGQWPVVSDPTGDPAIPAPVVSVDADGLYGAGTFGASSLAVSGTDYALLPDGELRWLGRGTLGGGGWGYGHCSGGWPYGQGNIRVVYHAGYQGACTTPADLKGAIMDIAAAKRVQSENGGRLVQKERLGQYQVEYADTTTAGGSRSAAPDPWKVLDRYRKVVVG